MSPSVPSVACSARRPPSPPVALTVGRSCHTPTGMCHKICRAAGRALTFDVMPPPDPVTSLRALSLEIARFADELEAATDLDARVLRHWHARLLEIAAQLERPSAR